VLEYYKKETRSCEKKPNFYPNANSNKWIINTDAGMAKIANLVKQQKATTNSAECPVATPFFNNNTKNCVSCAQD
jgi:hypothetical protein